MFKKVVVFALFVVLILSMCACSKSGKTTINGEEVVLQNNESVTITSGNFVVDKVDWTCYGISGHGKNDCFFATLSNNDYIVTIAVDIEQYSRWQSNDVFEDCNVEKTWESAYGCFRTYLVLGNQQFLVRWIGENTRNK